ncbi:MAG: hypothetical protein ACOYIK_02515, partial [Coriobacteriales bacterium]
ERVDDHHVYLPECGVSVATEKSVPRDVKMMGTREFFLERVDGPGENCFRVRCDRVSDSRFERTVLLGFEDSKLAKSGVFDEDANEMAYLHQHLYWKVDKLSVAEDSLPVRDEVLWIRIPEDKIYLVSR